MSALDRLNEETVRRNNELINQENNSFNFGKTQRQQSVTSLEDGLLAAVDRNRAYQDVKMKSPSYIAEQNKMNVQNFAKALQDTKQVKGMSYNGNAVKQGSDGKYYTADGNEVTDVTNIQKDYQFDPIAGAINASEQGNLLGMQSYLEQSKPKSGMDLADKMLLAQQQATYKKDIADSKPKKYTDGKMSELSKTKDIVGELTPWLGLNDKKTSEVSNIVNQGLLDPQLKNANVLEALNQAKAASSQWYKGKTDVDTDLLTKLLTQYRNN